MVSNKKKNIEIREKIIGYIYSYELFSKKLENIKALENGEYSEKEIRIIEKISINYNLFKKMIIQYTKKNWDWERIQPLARSILIYGTFELSFANKKIIIDILIHYCKNFIPDDTYKFINSILDNIGKYYEKIKINKEKTKKK